MRHTHRTDANQKEIVSKLRELGAKVVLLHNVGNSCPDLLVGYRGRTWLMEAKGESMRKRFSKTGGLSPGQVDWHDAWPGGELVTVNSPAQEVYALL